MPTEPSGPTNRPPPAREPVRKAPGLPKQEPSDVSFLSDDPLIPLPVIDLEPLPILEPEPEEEDETETMLVRKPHLPLGLIVDIRA